MNTIETPLAFPSHSEMYKKGIGKGRKLICHVSNLKHVNSSYEKRKRGEKSLNTDRSINE